MYESAEQNPLAEKWSKTVMNLAAPDKTVPGDVYLTSSYGDESAEDYFTDSTWTESNGNQEFKICTP
jgi:hypothetical protein